MEYLTKANLSAASGGASTMFSAMGQMRAGDAAAISAGRKKMALDSQAAQLDTNAGQQVASAQRAAENESLAGRLAASRALALAAASGGGASDPTIINLMAGLAGQGTYNAMTQLYQGKEKARAMHDQANMARYSGQMAEADGQEAKRASRFAAINTIMGGAASLYSRFGKQSDPAAGGSIPEMTSYYDYGVS